MASISSEAISASVTAPSNIAVIKYWGKRDTKLNLPINSSVSVTLNQDDMKAITTITAVKNLDHDQLWLNGVYVGRRHKGLWHALVCCC